MKKVCQVILMRKNYIKIINYSKCSITHTIKDNFLKDKFWKAIPSVFNWLIYIKWECAVHFSAVWLKDRYWYKDFTRKIPRQWHLKSYLCYRISSSDSISHSEWHLGILDICAEGMGFQKVIFPFFLLRLGKTFTLPYLKY